MDDEHGDFGLEVKERCVCVRQRQAHWGRGFLGSTIKLVQDGLKGRRCFWCRPNTHKCLHMEVFVL